MPVRDHAAIPPVRERDGHRRVPVVDPARRRQVDAFLVLQDVVTEVSVHVGAERGAQAGADPEAARGDREVGDAARARAHAGRPYFDARPRQLVQPGEDDVEKDDPGNKKVDWLGFHPTILRGEVPTTPANWWLRRRGGGGFDGGR